MPPQYSTTDPTADNRLRARLRDLIAAHLPDHSNASASRTLTALVFDAYRLGVADGAGPPLVRDPAPSAPAEPAHPSPLLTLRDCALDAYRIAEAVREEAERQQRQAEDARAVQVNLRIGREFASRFNCPEPHVSGRGDILADDLTVQGIVPAWWWDPENKPEVNRASMWLPIEFTFELILPCPGGCGWSTTTEITDLESLGKALATAPEHPPGESCPACGRAEEF